MALILRYFAEFSSSGANYVKLVEVTYTSATKCIPKNLLSGNISLCDVELANNLCLCLSQQSAYKGNKCVKSVTFRF